MVGAWFYNRRHAHLRKRTLQCSCPLAIPHVFSIHRTSIKSAFTEPLQDSAHPIRYSAQNHRRSLFGFLPRKVCQPCYDFTFYNNCLIFRRTIEATQSVVLRIIICAIILTDSVEASILYGNSIARQQPLTIHLTLVQNQLRREQHGISERLSRKRYAVSHPKPCPRTHCRCRGQHPADLRRCFGQRRDQTVQDIEGKPGRYGLTGNPCSNLG